MLYESKADGSLAAHATQTNLRLVKDDSPQGMTVRHDHSLRRALNRGHDFKEFKQLHDAKDQLLKERIHLLEDIQSAQNAMTEGEDLHDLSTAIDAL